MVRPLWKGRPVGGNRGCCLSRGTEVAKREGIDANRTFFTVLLVDYLGRRQYQSHTNCSISLGIHAQFPWDVDFLQQIACLHIHKTVHVSNNSFGLVSLGF